MDFPNNPTDGDIIRLGKQRYIAQGGVWKKYDGEKVVTVTAGAIDMAKGEVFVMNLAGTAVTVTVSNPLASGEYDEFLLEIVCTAATNVTWPSSFKWPGGTPPTLPSSGRAVVGGYTRDGGVRYEMTTISSDSK